MKSRFYNKKKIGALCIIMVLALTFIVSGCGKEDSSTLHVGYFNNITHAQALYMKSQGTLQEALGDDVKVEWTAFNAGPAEIEALFSGDIDIGYIGPVPAIMAREKSKGDVTVLSGASTAGAELVVAADSGITSVKQLSGKKVSIPQIGNTQHLCLLKLLADNGLAPADAGGDVTVTAVENADLQNMMDSGNVDAALVPEPWASVLVSSGGKILLDYDEVYMNGDYPVAVVVVRNDYLKDHKEEVDLFMQKHERATLFIKDNVEEAAAIANQEIKEATGKSIDETILNQAFEKIGFSTELNEASMDEFEELARKEGFIE